MNRRLPDWIDLYEQQAKHSLEEAQFLLNPFTRLEQENFNH